MKVHLENLKFYGYHGVAPEENILGQRFIINFTFETLAENDKKILELADTVVYTKVYAIIKHIIEDHKFQLLESCANMILDEVMNAFPTIISSNVKIKKPSVPINGIMDGVELEMERIR